MYFFIFLKKWWLGRGWCGLTHMSISVIIGRIGFGSGQMEPIFFSVSWFGFFGHSSIRIGSVRVFGKNLFLFIIFRWVEFGRIFEFQVKNFSPYPAQLYSGLKNTIPSPAHALFIYLGGGRRFGFFMESVGLTVSSGLIRSGPCLVEDCKKFRENFLHFDHKFRVPNKV